LEGGAEFFQTTLAAPPGSDGNAEAIDINSDADDQIMFTSEGSFVDAVGDPVNVTLTFATNQQHGTETAVVISGVTAMVSAWRWDGSQWVK
jgi:hypothetical protein